MHTRGPLELVFLSLLLTDFFIQWWLVASAMFLFIARLLPFFRSSITPHTSHKTLLLLFSCLLRQAIAKKERKKKMGEKTHS